MKNVFIILFLLCFAAMPIDAQKRNKKSKVNAKTKTATVQKKTSVKKQVLKKTQPRRVKRNPLRVININPTPMVQTVGFSTLIFSSKTYVLISVQCFGTKIIISSLMTLYPFLREDKDSLAMFIKELEALQPEIYNVSLDKIVFEKKDATSQTVTTILQSVQQLFGNDYQVNVIVPHSCENLVKTPLFVF